MRVLIADDHPLFLSAVRVHVERLFPDVVIEIADSLTAALAIMQEPERRDLLLIDYSMPGMEGDSGVLALVAASDGAPVVVMSGVAIAEEVFGCIAAGAKGFLPKTLDGKIFASALHLVLAGGSYLPAEMAGSASSRPALPAADKSSGAEGYSERDRAILTMVVDGKSNKEIARLLNLQEVTIKVQLTRLYKKLGAKNRAHAATLLAQGKVLG